MKSIKEIESEILVLCKKKFGDSVINIKLVGMGPAFIMEQTKGKQLSDCLDESFIEEVFEKVLKNRWD